MPAQPRATLEAEADLITDETSALANSALRVGGTLRDMVDSMALLSEVGPGAGLTTAGAGLTNSPAGTVNVVSANGLITVNPDSIQLSDLAGLSLLGRATNSTGVMAAITAGTDGHILRRSGTTIGFGLAVNDNIDPAAAIAGTKIDPDFGAQDVTTTGAYIHGAAPAGAGAIRLTFGDDVVSTDGSAVDRTLLEASNFFGANICFVGRGLVGAAWDTTVVGAVNDVLLSVNGTVKLTVAAALSSFTTAVAIGAAPATTGALRVSQANGINGLATDGVTNRQLVGWGVAGSNILELGDGNTAVRIRGTSGSTGLYVGSTATLSVSATGVSIDNGSNLLWAATATAPLIAQTNTSGTAANFTIRAQGDTSGPGGALQFQGGRGSTLRGALRWQLNADDSAVQTGLELCEVVAGNAVLALCRLSNLTSTQMPANTGNGVIYIGDYDLAPTANPVGGVILAAKSSGGTGVGEGLRIRCPNGEAAIGSTGSATDGNDLYLYTAAGSASGGDMFITSGGAPTTDVSGNVSIGTGQADVTVGAVAIWTGGIGVGSERFRANGTGIGFFGATPVAKPTGVAVTDAAIHAALVDLGLIAA